MLFGGDWGQCTRCTRIPNQAGTEGIGDQGYGTGHVTWPKGGGAPKGNYDGLDKLATWMGVGRLDKEGMIRLDKGVMEITKKGNFDGLHNIPKKEKA